MCGIAGLVDLSGDLLSINSLNPICEHLHHRGPDASGIHLDYPVILGQTRLSVIDLVSGQQPLSNEDGNIWITFNGEIYNFQSLRVQLQQLGHRFITNSDTEVIVHAYEQYGYKCLEYLRGMFAFAIWDRNQKILFLARDRIGKKPLFYARTSNRLIFASEFQALVSHPAVRRQIDFSSIDAYLTYGYVPAPATPFIGVNKLPPAHFLFCQINDNGTDFSAFRIDSYWTLEYSPKFDLDEVTATEQLLELLSESVRIRMISDVSLGALLSGGVDSSLIVALMSKISGRAIKTFSIGFDESEFNELPYARAVAKLYGTDHHELIVRPDAIDLLPKLVHHYGEPFADSSAIPSYYVAQLARQHVTVALNGDGGDESFAGYDRYLGSLLVDRFLRLPGFLRKPIATIGSLIPDWLPRRSRIRQLKRLLQVAELPLSERYMRWVGYLSESQKLDLYTTDHSQQFIKFYSSEWIQSEFRSAGNHITDPLDQLLSVDVRSYLPYDLLVKMDIATMACSLEARSPLLDHKVMEFAARLPTSLKVRNTTLKYLLKRCAEPLLPKEHLVRRKMGFGVPVGVWMRNELRPLLHDILLAPGAHTHAFLRADKIRLLVDQHSSGSRDHGNTLWSLLWLELWFREFA